MQAEQWKQLGSSRINASSRLARWKTDGHRDEDTKLLTMHRVDEPNNLTADDEQPTANSGRFSLTMHN